ncbi:hypothetical protein F4677DRAFT_459001 [Hypoxylon crocopeplum]|nr:hypothetical protein F4677DRAFT_459001 [Hypoxylon crocopeplum]
MPSAKKIAVSTASLLALVQLCPAPWLASIPIATATALGTGASIVAAAGIVAGDVINGIQDRRVRRNELGVKREQFNKLAWRSCHSQLGSATVNFSAPAAGSIYVKGVPPACMTLLTVITGVFDEGNPVPQGNDAVLFEGLSNADIKEIQDALDAHHSRKI